MRLFVFLLVACDGVTPRPSSRDAAERSDAGSEPVDAGAPVVHDPTAARAALEAELARSGTPGAAIAVVIDGNVAFGLGAGVLRRGATDPVEADTPFMIGSIAKTFTAALAMDLREEGAIDLARPMGEYASSLEVAPAGFAPELTLHRLLSHTSGEPRYLPEEAYSLPCSAGGEGMRMFFGALGPVELWYEPGRLFHYSNHGFTTAGFVLQEAAGREFSALLEERIVAPLGLTATTLDPAVARANGAASGLSAMGEIVDPEAMRSCGYGEPAGATLWSSANDLAAFATMLLGRRGVLEPASIELMTSAHASGVYASSEYGYGLFIHHVYGRRVVEHGGSVYGYLAELLLVPEVGFAVAVVGGSETMDVTGVAQEVMAAYVREGTARGPEPDPPRPASEWSRYEGTYRFGDRTRGTATVRVVGSALEVDGRAVSAFARDWFEDAQGVYHFVEDASGTVRWLDQDWVVAERSP
jgi:D-alanyl-D-alanine carboxypeptidase